METKKDILCKGSSIGDAWVPREYGTVKEVQVTEYIEYRSDKSREVSRALVTEGLGAKLRYKVCIRKQEGVTEG